MYPAEILSLLVDIAKQAGALTAAKLTAQQAELQSRAGSKWTCGYNVMIAIKLLESDKRWWLGFYGYRTNCSSVNEYFTTRIFENISIINRGLK